jgi:hypothetical protein
MQQAIRWITTVLLGIASSRRKIHASHGEDIVNKTARILTVVPEPPQVTLFCLPVLLQRVGTGNG